MRFKSAQGIYSVREAGLHKASAKTLIHQD